MQLEHKEIPFERKTFPITLVCDNIYFKQNIGSLFIIKEAFGIKEIIFSKKFLSIQEKQIKIPEVLLFMYPIP